MRNLRPAELQIRQDGGCALYAKYKITKRNKKIFNDILLEYFGCWKLYMYLCR